MPEVTVTVTHEVGLHARPASKFVQTATKFSSDIEVVHGETTANAKSILNILLLAAEAGAIITVEIEGDDENEAMLAIETLFENKFNPFIS